jgi:hypothetical protein
MRQWTQSEMEQVGELLQRKLTAGQIARQFAGRSRSGIISLVNRIPPLRAIGFCHSNLTTHRRRSPQ